jgi:hypothetical protein
VRDFTWHVFTQTGDIEAYLLYREMHALGTIGSLPEDGAEEENGGTVGDVIGFGAPEN